MTKDPKGAADLSGKALRGDVGVGKANTNQFDPLQELKWNEKVTEPIGDIFTGKNLTRYVGRMIGGDVHRIIEAHNAAVEAAYEKGRKDVAREIRDQGRAI